MANPQNSAKGFIPLHLNRDENDVIYVNYENIRDIVMTADAGTLIAYAGEDDFVLVKEPPMAIIDLIAANQAHDDLNFYEWFSKYVDLHPAIVTKISNVHARAYFEEGRSPQTAVNLDIMRNDTL